MRDSTRGNIRGNIWDDIWQRNSAAVAAATAVLLAAGTGRARAQGTVHGRVEVGGTIASESAQSLSAALGERTRVDALGDVRLGWEPHVGAWRFAVQYDLTVDAGDTPPLGAEGGGLGAFVASPPTTWWDLRDTTIHDRHLTVAQRIDRLSLEYAGAHLVLRAGRQALTWGSGIVFHPMDLFDPFAPNAVDVEYKPGTDMVYGQWLFDDGADVQAIAVPRPARAGDAPAADASSYAAHGHAAIGTVQTTWLAARDWGDWVAGVGVAGTLGGAAWNVELVPTFVRDGGTATSALANVTDARTAWGKDITLFGEYYRNGFGMRSRHYALSDLPAPLRNRLVRGTLFDTGRDYLAAGATVQWTPLLQVAPTLIAALNDGSGVGIVQATYSLRNTLNLVAGAQVPIGPARTEFGGIPLTGEGPPLLEQPNMTYVQLRQYF